MTKKGVVEETMTIFVLGGYGGIGRIFCRYLLRETNANIVIGGRRLEKAEELASHLKLAYPPERISARYVDACNRESFRAAFQRIDFVLIAATTSEFVCDIAEETLSANADYLDVYYNQEVYAKLETLRERIKNAGRCFVTQAGFHPGLPAVCVRKGTALFDTCTSTLLNPSMSLSMHWVKIRRRYLMEVGGKKRRTKISQTSILARGLDRAHASLSIWLR
jgi:saccharopine dehydrogenase-like NADP-dependent oxidoreductase